MATHPTHPCLLRVYFGAEQTGDVLVLSQRSGAPSWVLESESRQRSESQAIELLAQTLRGVVSDESLAHKFATLVAENLPWARFLPCTDRVQFIKEISETLEPCASVGKFAALSTLISDWRNTAEIWADPDLADALSTPTESALNQPLNLTYPSAVTG